MSEENVLVVDDEAVIRDVCEQILEERGLRVTVTTAASGKEALHLVSEHSYDAVVTDIRCRTCPVWKLLEVIKRTSMDVSTVVITGLGTFDMATQSDRLGAKEFVVKPFTPDELSDAVRKALRKRVVGAG